MIAVAICTYNPDERLLERVLAAVLSQQISSSDFSECVIVDNNSSPPVRELPSVKEFLNRCNLARVIVEPRQGLTYARLAAIENTAAPFLCFVDDDNEPMSDYLSSSIRILSERPCIGVIGAGRIEVDFVDPVPDEFAQRFSHHFQQIDYKGLGYGSVCGTWTEYYPPGSSMVVRREVLATFREAFFTGQISATDRVGAKLTSGGDTQIVWEAVKMGLAAGISSELRLTHMVPSKRSTLSYMKRLCYGTSSSYLPALVDSFPSERSRLPTAPTNARIIWTVMRMTGSHLLRNKLNLLPIEIATYLGQTAGLVRASGARRQFLDHCIRSLGLE